MAATKSRSSSTFSRHVAPFAPLALALAVGAATSGGPSATVGTVSSQPATVAGVKAGDLQVEQCEDVQDSAECHAKYRSGCNNSSKSYDTYLNYVKNTIDFSGAAQPSTFWDTLEQFQAKEQQLQALEQKLGVKLSTGNHDSFAEPLKNLGEGALQGALGYLYAITPETGGTGETSNCKLTQSESDVDFHIFIGFDSNRAAEILTSPNSAKLADKAKSIVVEMTPHYRAAFQPNWNSEVVKSVRGRKVKVVGQLMVDNDHNDTKDDCGVIGATSNCWRATVWELHPVTMFQVCMAADNNCDVNSSNWVDLEKLSAGAAGTQGHRTPKKNEAGGSDGDF